MVVEFPTEDGLVRAVDGVSYDVAPGEIVGVVGESGSGKSVTALSVLGLIRPPGRVAAGQIRFRGQDLLQASRRELRTLRGREIGLISQDPMTALNPVISVGRQIAEALRLHQRGMSRAAARERVVELLGTVGIPNPRARYREYPHQYSGGMRQRALIAMAMANHPALLIADEPTTALDVTIQAQVLELLRTAQRETSAATLLITHDLGVIAELADRVVVMYAGRVIEQGNVHTVFNAPRHPYTVGLLSGRPLLSGEITELRPIPGSPPSLLTRPPGCPFQPRCSLGGARTRCGSERPRLQTVAPGHVSACHYHDELGEPAEAEVMAR
ncbi:ABC transporter ATP-binding protein [Actinomadura rubrisoli]|uniref:ABC transporter ATP-binding protein n=1 Tax=Actinomadura rubrisoli TaxID=2530368 RepID=A0A4R5CE03_9ACTN|nr:ABC transporter ATP-binding protein [Actinomadura rubrisoli]